MNDNNVFIFQTISDIVKKNVFYSVPLVFDFWDEFEFCELTENMRQKEDPSFALLLDRVRVGTPNDQDIDDLTLQIIRSKKTYNKCEYACDKFIEFTQNDQHVLTLVPLTNTTNQINEALTNRMRINVTNIQAIDSNKIQLRNIKRRKTKKITIKG